MSITKVMIDMDGRWKDKKIGDNISVPLCDENGCRRVVGEIVKMENKITKVYSVFPNTDDGIESERKHITIEIN